MSLETKTLRSLLQNNENDRVIQILSQVRGKPRTLLKQYLPELGQRLRELRANEVERREREEAIIKQELLQLIDRLQQQTETKAAPRNIASGNSEPVISTDTEAGHRKDDMATPNYTETLAREVHTQAYVVEQTSPARTSSDVEASEKKGVPAGGILFLAVLAAVCTLVAIALAGKTYLAEGSIPEYLNVALPLLAVAFMVTVAWYLTASIAERARRIGLR